MRTTTSILTLAIALSGCGKFKHPNEEKAKEDALDGAGLPKVHFSGPECSEVGPTIGSTPGLSVQDSKIPLPKWDIRLLGNEVGNGGSAVVCRDTASAITSIEPLDTYEAREIFQLTIDLGVSGMTWKARAEAVVERLARFEPYRRDKYRKLLDEFEANASFKGGIDLATLPDADYLFIPAGCKTEQVIISNPPQTAVKKRFLVNQILWNALNEEGRAALVLHEIVYDEALEAGQTNAVNARKFNGQLISSGFADMPIGKYFALLSESALLVYQYGGYRISKVGQATHNTQFESYANSHLPKRATLESPVTLKIGSLTFEATTAEVAFAESGNILEMYANRKLPPETYDRYKNIPAPYDLNYPYAESYPAYAFPLPLTGICLHHPISFFESKSIRSGYYFGPTRKVPMVDGVEHIVHRMDRLEFTEDGRIVAVGSDQVSEKWHSTFIDDLDIQ